MIGQAQTGTGKTAAFLIPFLNRWRPHKLKGPIGVVMTPTRELALQIATEADRLAPSSNSAACQSTAAPGCSVSSKGCRRGCDLVVGTPGRMLDHLQRGSMSLVSGPLRGSRRSRPDARHRLPRRHRTHLEALPDRAANAAHVRDRAGLDQEAREPLHDATRFTCT